MNREDNNIALRQRVGARRWRWSPSKKNRSIETPRPEGEENEERECRRWSTRDHPLLREESEIAGSRFTDVSLSRTSTNDGRLLLACGGREGCVLRQKTPRRHLQQHGNKSASGRATRGRVRAGSRRSFLLVFLVKNSLKFGENGASRGEKRFVQYFSSLAATSRRGTALRNCGERKKVNTIDEVTEREEERQKYRVTILTQGRAGSTRSVYV